MENEDERGVSQFAAALEQLRREAGASYGQISRYGSSQAAAVKYPQSTLDGWFTGKNVPQGGKRFELLVDFLERLAKKKPGHQTASTEVWEKRRAAAEQARRRKERPDTDAPLEQPADQPAPAPASNAVPMPTALGDRQKAERLVTAIPVNASWLTELRLQPSFHKVKDRVQGPLFAAQVAVRADFLKFTDGQLQNQYERFVAALDEMCLALTELANDAGGATYSYIPPEWRREQPSRYAQTNQDIKSARDVFIHEYEGMVQLLNSRALLPG